MDNRGTLAAPELLIDMTAYAAEFLTGENSLKAIEVTESGGLLMGTDHGNSLFLLKDGAVEPMYQGILPSPAKVLTYGGGNELYMSLGMDHENFNLIRIEMGEKGAEK